MPIQSFNRGPSLGGNLGSALSAGLESLSQAKMQQLEKQNRIKGLESLGFAPQEAKNFSGLDPNLLQLVVQQRLQEPSQQAFAQGLQSILGGGQSTEAQQPSIQQHPQSQAPQQQMTEEQFNQLQRAVPGLPLGAYQGAPPQRQNLPSQVAQSQPGVPHIPSKLNPQQAMQLAQLGLQKQALGKKEQAEQKKQDAKNQIAIDKETLPYYNEVLKEDKAAKDIDIKTGRMIQLIEKGKLPDPVYYKQLKDLEEGLSPFRTIASAAGAGATSGGIAGGLLGSPLGIIGSGLGSAAGGLIGAALGAYAGLKASQYPTKKRGELLKEFPDTEEFEKLSNSFISGAKAIFGSRITDQDLKAFMATVPQLSNTEAGKKAIIKNIRLMNEAAHVKANTMKKVIEDNGGRRPANLALLVDELSGPELDRLAKEFIGG